MCANIEMMWLHMLRILHTEILCLIWSIHSQANEKYFCIIPYRKQEVDIEEHQKQLTMYVLSM